MVGLDFTELWIKSWQSFVTYDNDLKQYDISSFHINKISKIH